MRRLLRVDVAGFLVQRALLVEPGDARSSGVWTGRDTAWANVATTSLLVGCCVTAGCCCVPMLRRRLT